MNQSLGQALKQLLHLIRWPNLLIVLLSMYFVRHFIILPIFDALSISSSLNELYFFQLVLAVIMITSGGYIQNDLLDQENDHLNGSVRLKFGKNISDKELDSLFKLFFFIGNALGFYIAFKAGRVQLGFIFLFATMLLFLYNRIFKSQFLFGNIIVSILSAFTLLLVPLFETPIIEQKTAVLGNYLPLLYTQVFAYASFAFIISLMREIVKDIQDLHGDRTMGMQTIPIILGVKVSKAIVVILGITCIAAVSYIAWVYGDNNQFSQATYIIAAVVLPLLIILFRLLKAEGSKQFGQVGLLLKFVMLTGILSMPIFYLLIQ